MAEQGWDAEKVKRMKIHASYIGVIIFVFFIYIATKQWSSIQNLVDKVNFAASVTSVLLAILAIVYAVWSNSASSATISALVAAAEKVDKSAASIGNASTELSSISETIRGDIKELSDKTVSLGFEVKSQNSKIDDLMQSSSQLYKKEVEQPIVSKADAKAFLQSTSLLGLAGAAIACKSAELDKKIHVGNTLRGTSFDESYIHGFLVAADSAGYFEDLRFTFEEGNLSVHARKSAKFSYEDVITYMNKILDETRGKFGENSYTKSVEHYIKSLENNIPK